MSEQVMFEAKGNNVGTYVTDIQSYKQAGKQTERQIAFAALTQCLVSSGQTL